MSSVEQQLFAVGVICIAAMYLWRSFRRGIESTEFDLGAADDEMFHRIEEVWIETDNVRLRVYHDPHLGYNRLIELSSRSEMNARRVRSVGDIPVLRVF